MAPAGSLGQTGSGNTCMSPTASKICQESGYICYTPLKCMPRCIAKPTCPSAFPHLSTCDAMGPQGGECHTAYGVCFNDASIATSDGNGPAGTWCLLDDAQYEQRFQN